jgi:hypothetical protein
VPINLTARIIFERVSGLGHISRRGGIPASATILRDRLTKKNGRKKLSADPAIRF